MSRLISPIELRDSVVSGQQLQLIDVRSASEYGSGHVPGAVNIPMEQLEVRLADLTQRGEIVLICQGGKRASTCANWIHDRRDVAVLEGGTTAWSKAGFPLTGCSSLSLVAGTPDPVWCRSHGSSRSFAGSDDFDQLAVSAFIHRLGTDVRGTYRYMSHGNVAGTNALESRLRQARSHSRRQRRMLFIDH